MSYEDMKMRIEKIESRLEDIIRRTEEFKIDVNIFEVKLINFSNRIDNLLMEAEAELEKYKK